MTTEGVHENSSTIIKDTLAYNNEKFFEPGQKILNIDKRNHFMIPLP